MSKRNKKNKIPSEAFEWPFYHRITFVASGWTLDEAYHVQFSDKLTASEAVRCAFDEFKKRYPLEARKGGAVFYGTVNSHVLNSVLSYRFINGKLWEYSLTFRISDASPTKPM